MNQQQYNEIKKPFKSKINYKTALSIIQDNPDIFNDADIRSLVEIWFGKDAVKVLEKDANDLKCGFGRIPKVKCKAHNCLMVDVCVHKDKSPLESDCIDKTDTELKKDSQKRIKISKDLGIKI